MDRRPDGDPAEKGAARAPSGTEPPRSDARISGMVATVALIFMFAFTGLVVWLAA